MGSIDFTKCSEEELWGYLEKLDKALEAYNVAELHYSSAKRERKRIKERLNFYDQYRYYNEEAAIRYEKLSIEYEELFDKEQEYHIKMLAVDFNKLREDYSELIEEKYWKLTGYMLLDYYGGQATEFKKTLDKYVKKLRIKRNKRS